MRRPRPEKPPPNGQRAGCQRDAPDRGRPGFPSRCCYYYQLRFPARLGYKSAVASGFRAARCATVQDAPLTGSNEESGLLGGEEGSGRGLGALTAPAGAFSAASPKTSTSRSPAFASSMIFLARFANRKI